MKNIRQVTLLLLLLPNLMGYAASSQTITTTTVTTAKPSNIYTDDKTNIMVTKNQPVFILKLKSNPTTGYSWFLREYDANLLTAVSHTFQHGDTGLMGAPGYELWTFRAKPAAFAVPMQTTIRMNYARPWQSSDTSTQLVFHVST